MLAKAWAASCQTRNSGKEQIVGGRNASPASRRQTGRRSAPQRMCFMKADAHSAMVLRRGKRRPTSRTPGRTHQSMWARLAGA